MIKDRNFSARPTQPAFLISTKNKEYARAEITKQFMVGEEYRPISLPKYEKFGIKIIASVLLLPDGKTWTRITDENMVRRIIT